jgi:PPOX class probable F420-dependent enzyme
MAIPDTLQTAPFIDLKTLRKNGDLVSTPVWAAEVEGALYVFSQTNAGKVKRIRNFATVKVAECTSSGKLKGSWHDATASLVEDKAEEQAAYTALRAKYGWKMAILNFGSTLTGKAKTRTVIRIDF